MTLSYTKFMHLAVPDFLTEPWHGEFAQAMDSIDQIVYQAIVLAKADLWENSHLYEIGDIVINPDSGGLFSCAVEHTSAASGSFTDELTAHPDYWTSVGVVLASKPEAEAGVENTKFMSALRVKQAIDAQRPLTAVATQTEAERGTENTHMMTPLRTAQAIAIRTSGVPQGRLSCLYDTPVMNIDVIATTTVYYTQYTGQTLPIFNGTRFEQTDFWDALVGFASDNIKAPAAIGADKINDWFIWTDTQDVTISSASPAVVTFPGPHGLAYNNPIQFKSTGQLPSPLEADRTYYVVSAGINATQFEISDTLQGTPINTSGPQTGVHTAQMRRLTHGPDWATDNVRGGPATLVRIRGIWLNAVDIVNGPKAQRGTYIGTTRSDPAPGGTFTWRFGKSDLTDPHGWHGVWNLYNRRPVVSTARYAAVSWNYQSATAREINDTTTNRVYHVRGLDEDGVDARHNQVSNGPANGTTQPLIRILPPPAGGQYRPDGYRTSYSDFVGNRSDNASWKGLPGIGWIVIGAAEQGIQIVGTTTMVGNSAGLGQVQALEVVFTA